MPLMNNIKEQKIIQVKLFERLF